MIRIIMNAKLSGRDADRSATLYTEQGLNLVKTDLEYEVTRVKSPVLGRDLNALGREEAQGS